MTSKLTVIRNLYKINRKNPRTIHGIFSQVKKIYHPGDYKQFYSDKANSMFDIVFNEYELYRVHLSVLEPGEIEKSCFSRQICLLEGKLSIIDKFCKINLNQGCYLARKNNSVKNINKKPCVLISHVDIKNNLQDLPLL